MRYYVKQIGENDCGFTCLKMLLAMVNKKTDYLYFPTPDIKSKSSLKELILFAKKENLILEASRIECKEDFYKFKSKKPFLAPLKNDDSLHMVLIKKVTKNKVLLYDPALGVYYENKQKFLSKRNGEMIEIVSYSPGSFKKTNINVIPKTMMFVTLFFQMASFISLMVATLFIDKNFSFFIPLGLFLAYIIFEFLYQKFLIMSLKSFDEKILVNDFVPRRDQIRKYYQPMNKFKYTIISTPLQIVNYFLILFFGLFLLAINSLTNLVILCSIFIIQILFRIFESFKVDQKYEYLGKLERKIFYDYSSNADDFEANIKELNNETYKYVGYLNFKKYFFVFLTISMCLIYLGFDGNISINFMLFHFFLYVYLEDYFDKILNLPKLINEIKYYKCLYLYYFC
ncbi:MAG: cysteine peptidase family C39 domain-containing protein [Candidatus Onthovivens sp.]|nr:cysteine peptidase family C39 domain-containing protein [Candidatus Onthovivens sp.]